MNPTKADLVDLCLFVSKSVFIKRVVWAPILCKSVSVSAIGRFSLSPRLLAQWALLNGARSAWTSFRLLAFCRWPRSKRLVGVPQPLQRIYLIGLPHRSTPCFDGHCSYDIPQSSAVSGTLQVVRRPSLLPGARRSEIRRSSGAPRMQFPT